MTNEEIEQIVDLPLSILAEECRAPQFLATVLSIIYNQGYKIGQEQAHRFYRMMLAGYNAITITN